MTEPEQEQHREGARAWWWLAGLWLVLAVALRLAHLPRQAVPGSDEAYNLQLAARVAAGEGLTSQYLFTLADPHPLPTAHIWEPPGYPLVLGAWTRVFGTSYPAAQVSSVVTGAAVVLCVGLLAGHFAGPRAGSAAAAAAALHPRLIEFSAVAMPDMLLTLGITGGLAGVAAAKRSGRAGWALGAGVLWGVAQASKSVAAVPFAIACVFALWPTRGAPRRPDWRTGLALAVGFAPWFGALLLYNVHTYGSVSGGAQGVINLAQEWIEREELYFTPGMVAQATATVDAVPLRLWIAHGANNLKDYLTVTPGAFHPLPLVLAAGGLALAVRRRRGVAVPVLATVLAFYALCTVRSWAEGRYLVPVVALACVWIGVLGDAVTARFPAAYAAPLATALVVVYGVGARMGVQWLAPAPRDPSLGRIAQLLRTDHASAAPPVIMERERRFTYPAGGWNVPLPVGGPDAVAAVARDWRVDYVVLDERTLAFRRRALLPWYEQPPPWLHFVGAVRAGAAGEWRVGLYRVVPEHLPPRAPS